MKNLTFLLALLAIVPCTLAQENVDLEAIEKIKDEGLNRSQIEEIAHNITDRSGPRLTNSPGYQRAASYALKQLGEWGFENTELEPWGEFGRGWELKKSYLAMTKPYYMPLIAFPNAWSESTDGFIAGKIEKLDIVDKDDFGDFEGQLKGRILMFPPPPSYIAQKGDPSPTFEADAVRFTPQELEAMKDPIDRESRWTPQELTARAARRQARNDVNNFLAAQEVGLVIRGAVGKHGTLFTSSRRDGWVADATKGLAEFNLAPEHYYLIERLVENGQEVEIEAEVQVEFQEEDLQGYNVLAEFPGTDPDLKSEVVMLGAHLDSWHGATGATDNGAGSIVMMEAMRILKATGLQPRRTIRIALWGGEEQGLNGSRGYVKNHFGDRETMNLKPEHSNISAYYNIDNGTGRIRGIYLQGNEQMRPIFNEWFEPLDDLIDARTITIRNTGGTDHLPFDWIGIPGFQFIQDGIEYDTRTHHTNMDTYDRLVMDDLRQIAVIVASFVYNTAQRDEKLPRESVEDLQTR